MNNLTKRVLSSIVFVIIIIGPLFISTRVAYSLYALLGFFTLNELNNIVVKTGGSVQRVPSYLLYVVFVFTVYEVVFEAGKMMQMLSLIMGVTALSSFFLEIFKKDPQPFQNLAASIVAPMFIASSFLGIAYFIEYRSDLPSIWITISLFALIWINDSAAYLIGRKIGKTKLNERLSPNKTIEGSAAGLITTLLAATALSFVEGMPAWHYMVPFGGVIVISGSLGDLFESRLKRAAGVKDSGVFLPGHGGFFDRFDAMMLAIPTAILYFEIVLPKS